MKLREGWNFTGDVANYLEMLGRKDFGFTDAEQVNSTIFESAVITMHSFVIVACILLCKKINYKDNEEVNKFINDYRNEIGLSAMEIGNDNAQEIILEFSRIYEKYN